MVAKHRGLYEVRTRIISNLPVNDELEEKAFFKFIDFLKKQKEIGVQGYTHSALRPAVFRGYWWSEKLDNWVPDNIVLCIVDYKLSFSDQELSGKIKELKETIRKWYRHFGSPQEEVWVVAQQIIRQD